jgi:hypothetical protein
MKSRVQYESFTGLSFIRFETPEAKALRERLEKLPKWAQAYIDELKTLQLEAADPAPPLEAIDNRVWCVESSVIGPKWG